MRHGEPQSGGETAESRPDVRAAKSSHPAQTHSALRRETVRQQVPHSLLRRSLVASPCSEVIQQLRDGRAAQSRSRRARRLLPSHRIGGAIPCPTSGRLHDDQLTQFELQPHLHEEHAVCGRECLVDEACALPCRRKQRTEAVVHGQPQAQPSPCSGGKCIETGEASRPARQGTGEGSTGVARGGE